uniref:L domain-like protein n=2 Tax=Helicotheca tamesis TaxID=374047 RepID=A0A7S2N1H5_9STRA|mmetsp:Transcript_7600/g.10340  ORF Transcript_7600/g.10340 Transcript_7600/m.10340 type:complete len:509 (+) Transcript_7600:52-1578(+)
MAKSDENEEIGSVDTQQASTTEMTGKSDDGPASASTFSDADGTADPGESIGGSKCEKDNDFNQSEGGNSNANNLATASEGVIVSVVASQPIPQESQLSRQISLPGAFRMTPEASVGIPASLGECSRDEDSNDTEDPDDRAAETNNDDRCDENNIQVEATLVVEPPVYEAHHISPHTEVTEEAAHPFCTLVVLGKRLSFGKRFCLCAALAAVVLIGASLTAVVIKSNGGNATDDPSQDKPNDPIQDGRFDDILPMIAQLSGYDILEDKESPQYKALDWIANKDRANITIWDKVRIVQRYVLAVIYYSTGGEEWTDKYSFLTDRHECEWSDDSGTLGVDGCNDDYITSLDFSENSLDGTIPTEVGHLTNLTAFRLLGNNVTGTIPTEFGLLTNMAFFSLVRNEGLRGHIPSELGNFNSVIGFWVNANSLSGSIPSELGQLTSVNYFALRDNNLTGEIPTSLANIKALISMELHMNSLHGSAEFMCENIAGDVVLTVDRSDVNCSCCGCCD